MTVYTLNFKKIFLQQLALCIDCITRDVPSGEASEAVPHLWKSYKVEKKNIEVIVFAKSMQLAT